MYERTLARPEAGHPAAMADGWGLVLRCAVLAVLVLLPIASTTAAQVKVVTASGALTGVAGATLVADYGAFSVYLIDESSPQVRQGAVGSSLQGRQGAVGAGLSVAAYMDTIALERFNLNPNTFNIKDIPPALRAGTVAGPGLQLIQFAGPIKRSWLNALAAGGATPVHYIANNAYLVWADDAARTRIDALQGVPLGAAPAAPLQFSLPYQPYFKLGASLADRVTRQTDSEEVVKLTIQVYRHAGLSATDGFIRARTKARWAPDQEILKYRNIHVEIRAADIADIAKRPDVVWMGERFERKLADEIQAQLVAGNLNAGRTGVSGPGYLTWLVASGASTDPNDYPILDLVDDGIGNGTVLSGDPTLHQFGLITNPSRLAYVQNCTGDPDGGSVGGHGHINASIAGGYDQTPGFPYVDPFGFQRGLGVSPYGRLAGTRIFGASGGDYSGCGGTNTGVIKKSWDGGARIISNSWTTDSLVSSYDDSSQAYDVGVRDADLVTPGNQEVIIVFAAGDEGPVGGTIGSPGTGKNVITVGASENDRPSYAGADWLEYCDFVPDGATVMDVAPISSRGPAPGGRVKPELIAPGTRIQGTASTNAAYDGSTLCGEYWPPGQTVFAASSATSSSTPAVAGTASVYYQWLQSHYGMTPSPALMKAYLMAHTTYLTGIGANDSLPSNAQGYGMPNMAQALDFSTDRYLLDQTRVFGNSGETWTWNGAVADPAKPVRITLAYTDQAGVLGTSPQVNDLNLAAQVGGTTYLGNVFSGSWSVPGGTPDPANNYEAVFLPAGTTGPIRITVTGFNIAGDGVPNNGDDTDQDFALVCSNCVDEPGFNLQVTPASLTLCAPGSAAVTLDVRSIMGFTNSVGLSASGQPANSSIDFTPNPVTPPGTSVATLSLGAGVAPGDYGILIGGTATGAAPHQTRFALAAFSAVAGAVKASSPPNGASGVVLRPSLQWQAASQAVSYEVQVATDAGFTHPVETAIVGTPGFIPVTALASNTKYFWRVRAANACGTGAWSVAYSFTTATMVCRTPDLLIPDTGSDSDALTVGLPGTVADLKVSIRATHPSIGYLSFTLVHEDTGTSVTLIDRPWFPAGNYGCGGQNIDAMLDDEAASPVEDTCASMVPTIGGTFRPNQALSAFDGQRLSGTWRLTVADVAPGGYTGTLDEWCLIPTLAAALFGDLDGDGCIGRNDVALLLAAVQAGTTVPATQDINHDGAVNRADTRALMQMYTHLPSGTCP